MLTAAAIRNAKPTSRDVASSLSTAQIPTNTHPAENDAEPTNVTASTGRSARSTSEPQMRRKNQAKERTGLQAIYAPPGRGQPEQEGAAVVGVLDPFDEAEVDVAAGAEEHGAQRVTELARNRGRR